MDPVFLPYAQVNGVPQESKLAQYMKRQTEGPPQQVLSSASALPSSLNALSLSDSGSIALKKVAGEFVPRGGAPSPLTASPYDSNTPPITNPSPTPQATYQENVGGTTYFFRSGSGAGGGAGDECPAPEDPGGAGPSSPHPPPDSAYFVSSQLRMDILRKNTLSLMTPDPSLHPELPVEVDNYHELFPLESVASVPRHQAVPFLTSTYRATHTKTGNKYCLRRIHGFRLPNSKCMSVVDMWKKLSHSNIVQLREVFTTKAFGDHSMIFVYDYYPESETLLSRHLGTAEASNGYTDSFSSDPNAPRPYSHQKNALLRHQHSGGMLAESLLWNYVIQLTGAVCVVHTAGLAVRCLDPSKVLHTGRGRLRISSPAVVDVLTFDSSAPAPLHLVPHYQQEDLHSLGKLLLALACRSLLAVQRESIQTSVELVARTYSADLRNLLVSLLSTSPQRSRSVVDLMPLIGARYYSQLDVVQVHSDTLYQELAKEVDNGRLLRILAKLATINERPELDLDPSWSETGDRYMLKLFRDHVFHQVTQEGRPFLDMAHIVQALNKLDSASHDKVCLMSRDEQSVLVVTFAELKHCLDQSFSELTAKSGGAQ